ncbi:hypothetical protein [Rickettsiella massiliensis]|uniref:hypothetical protein n=1 Tax=Rickettsiella massiliensis TaxID=676517 RepID=UPI00178C3112|nr:hypothetical protein [Rickettsiella massiliensis]
MNGKALLDELEKTINRFITFPSSYEAKAIILHILFTYCTNVFDYSPILNVCSPAAIFRSIDKWNLMKQILFY